MSEDNKKVFFVRSVCCKSPWNLTVAEDSECDLECANCGRTIGGAFVVTRYEIGEPDVG